MSNDKIELKPCPFCGGKAEMISDFDDEHYVYCTGCKGGWKTTETPEEAAESWNRRTEIAISSPTTEKSLAVGNAAAMREALEKLWKEVYFYAFDEEKQDFQHLQEAMLENPPDYKSLRNSFFAIAHLIDAALSAPPRNCDRINSGDPTKDAADAYDEWQRHCDGSLMPPSCKVESAFRQWLLAPAKAETKGEDNGSI